MIKAIFSFGLWILFTSCVSVFAQDVIQTKQYPQNFFRYPLDLPPSTAGSFGELRSNHFHSGLDFKTNHRTGYPIHAAYDGYVSRLRVQFGGFGNAIYITHPNGYVTVYGHLERYSPEFAKLIHDYQYQQQSFEVDMSFGPMQLPVKKDQVVAWSGNAGASAGPHLHFEIRDALTQETINPQLFGLTIPDKIPPYINGMYAYHLNGNPFSEQTLKDYFAVAGANGSYHLLKPVISLSGEAGFGILASDMNSTSPNRNGVYSIQLNMDGKPVYTFAVERFAFDETHAINAHIDFPAYLLTDREIQKSFILPGNKISVYPQSVNRGVITFNDDALHDMEYIVKDVLGNTSTLQFKVKSSPSKIPVTKPKTIGTLFKYDRQNEFNTDQVKVSIPLGNLYDDLNFNYSLLPSRYGYNSAIHRIHNHYTPIHDSYELWIKPDSTFKAAYRGKAVIVNTTGPTHLGTYDNGFIKASVKSFGDYGVRVDTVPPIIYPVNIAEGKNMANLKAIYLRATDNLSGIKSYTGKIDGKWVLVEWDFKSKIFSFTFDDTIKPGKHIFSFSVADYTNNQTQYTANFYR